MDRTTKPNRQIESILPLEIECRYPADFSDESIQVPADLREKAAYGRLVTVGSPKVPFQAGSKVRMFFTVPILYAASVPTESAAIEVVGKVMRRNDLLEVTVNRALTTPLQIAVASDRDAKVKCVGIPR